MCLSHVAIIKFGYGSGFGDVASQSTCTNNAEKNNERNQGGSLTTAFSAYSLIN